MKFRISDVQKDIAVILCVLILFVGVYGTQKLIQNLDENVLSEKLLYFPSGKHLKASVVGYDAVVADVLWAKTVVYFGGHFRTDKDYKWLYHMVDIITTLDPSFTYAYHFGGTLLALEAGQVDKSITLLKKGLRNNPSDWRFYFELGFNYLYYKNDYEKASEYFQKATQFEGHPAYLPRLVARLNAKMGKIDAGLEFLKEAYKRYDNQAAKEAIAGRIKELIIEQHKLFLEKRVKIYKEKYGRYPNHLKELVQAGLLKKIPVEPFGGQYVINPETGKIKSTKESENWP